MPNRRRWPWVLASLAAVVAALALLWDWNWFRPLIERQVAAALQRPVALGHFDLHLGREPELVLDRLVLGNPPDFPDGSHTATINRLSLSIEPRALFRHLVRLTRIEIDQPSADLALGSSGAPNWKLQTASAGEPGQHPWDVDVRQLLIRDGQIHFLDPALKS